MRKRLLFCILTILMLSGCSRLDNYAARRAGVYEDTDYQNYAEWKKEGELDADGHYRDEAREAMENTAPKGRVHVTFAKNSYIEVSYYLDDALTTPVEERACYLEPGGCLYASEPVCDNPNSDLYHFDGFRVWEYGENGKRTELSLSGEGKLVLEIPADFSGTEISVEPVGRYEDRVLSLHDYCIDSAGNKKEIGGTWLVNSEETAGALCRINPVASYSVDYEYDAEKYFFVSSKPFSFYHDNGRVSFETMDAGSGVTEFSVELRSYADAGDFVFDPLEYSFEHGEITFFYQGEAVSERLPLRNGSVLSYKAEPESGYRLPDGDHRIVVDGEETEEVIRSIRLYPEKQALVRLPQPEAGGSVTYFIDGKRITTSECMVNVGTPIQMEFSPWNGWVCEHLDGTEYTVTETANQTVNVGGFFREADAYKPILSVVLREGVKDARFGIQAQGVDKKELDYEGGDMPSGMAGWFGASDRRIFEGRIGTADGITLEIGHDAIVNGSAVKLEIVKTDSSGNESKEIRYITKLPVQEWIMVYDGAPSALCQQIAITVDKVPVADCQTYSVEHAQLEVKFFDVNAGVCEPEEGSVAEPSREVMVTLSPKEGYYVSGYGVKDGIYKKSMKYSEWLSRAEEILAKHPVKKILHITLEETDAYGSCVYKLDGKRVSGTIEIREGQWLTLEYLVTDPGYKIVRDNGLMGFIADSFGGSTAIKSIEVSEAMDGAVIRREDYIRLERKGG